MSKAKRQRLFQPCRVVVGSSDIVTFYVPYNEAFLDEFKNVIHKDARHYNPDRKLWQVKPDVTAAVVEVLRRHFPKIEGLEDLIASPFDTLRITADASTLMVKMAARMLRAEYHPDAINQDNYRELFPESTSLADAKARGTAYCQEIGEALEMIINSRRTEDV